MEVAKCKLVIHIYRGSGAIPTYELQVWSEARRRWYALSSGPRKKVLGEMERLGVSQDIKHEQCIHEE